MKKKNLKIYAGALLLTGAIAISSISIAHNLLNKELSNTQQEQTSVVVADDITVALERIYLDDGTELHKLPAGYYLYHVNDEYPIAGMMSVYEQTEEYTIFNGNTTKITSDGETQICSLNGCIGVKEEYWKTLNAAEYLKKILEGNSSSIADEDIVKAYDIIKYGEELERIISEEYYDSYNKKGNKVH